MCVFRAFCPEALEQPEPEPNEARAAPLIPRNQQARNVQMINLNLDEGHVPNDEAELWGVVFTVPRGRRIHLNRKTVQRCITAILRRWKCIKHASSAEAWKTESKHRHQRLKLHQRLSPKRCKHRAGRTAEGAEGKTQRRRGQTRQSGEHRLSLKGNR